MSVTLKNLESALAGESMAHNQIAESKEHAEEFKAVLVKAEKRFAALAKVEQRHAEAYQQIWETVK